jgi:predicted enzyme related to lactoylglutathione lyase
MSAEHFPVGWFEIYVQEMPRAKAFYEKTFQTTLTRIEGAAVELWTFPMQKESPGCPGALVKMEGKDSGPGGTIVYFSCADCAVEAERAGSNGGTVQRPKFSIGQHGFISFVQDTEGNLIGLHSMK